MICRACHTEKAAGDFYPGVASRCKDCHKTAMKFRRLTDPSVQKYDCERAKLPARKEMARKIKVRWRGDNPLAYKAQTAVNNAIRDGRLTKSPCSLCGTDENLHAHHKNYNRPLDVTWLCAKCHHRIHAIFPELRGHK